MIDGTAHTFPNAEEALKSEFALSGCRITSIEANSGRLCITVERWLPEDDESYKAWVARYTEENGTEPSFF